MAKPIHVMADVCRARILAWWNARETQPLRAQHWKTRCLVLLTSAQAMSVLGHCLWMLGQIDGQSHDKAHRWIGFVQGVMWMTGVATINQMKDDNRSEQCDTKENG